MQKHNAIWALLNFKKLHNIKNINNQPEILKSLASRGFRLPVLHGPQVKVDLCIERLLASACS